jgi:hypothetical protein
MSQLAKLQNDFQAYIIDQAKGVDFKQRIVNDKKVGAKKRLGIYADGYRLRIIEALATAYPKLQAFLGGQLFNQTARAYIDAYPSHYRNMRWVGDEMDTHLRKTLPQHVIAAELARFEWVLGLAFDADDAPILQLQDLAEVPPEAWGELRFAFHPSLQLLDLDWNVIPVWQSLDADETPPEPQEIHEPCLVWRSDMNSHYRTIEVLEHKAVQNVMAGATFAALCEGLFTTLGDDATQQAAQYLSTWLEAGMISNIQT